MPGQVSAVMVCEPKYAPGTFVVIRADAPDYDLKLVWCGRSMGWLPLATTSNAFFRFFDSEQGAAEAAEKYVTLPAQE